MGYLWRCLTFTISITVFNDSFRMVVSGDKGVLKLGLSD